MTTSTAFMEKPTLCLWSIVRKCTANECPLEHPTPGKYSAEHHEEFREFVKMKQNKKKCSYGVVPWILIDRKWYCILQLSYSASEYDMKVDPFRGTVKPFEHGYETASRELFEESAHLFDITLNAMLEPDADGLYHVEFRFKDEELGKLVDCYDANRNLIQRCNPKSVLETAGILIATTDELRESSSPRLASQVRTMLLRHQHEKPNLVSAFCLSRETIGGLEIYKGCSALDDFLGHSILDDFRGHSIPEVDRWQQSQMVSKVRHHDEVRNLMRSALKVTEDWADVEMFLWMSKAQQIQQYPREHEMKMPRTLVQSLQPPPAPNSMSDVPTRNQAPVPKATLKYVVPAKRRENE